MTDPDAPTAPLPRSKPRREPIRKPGPLTVIAGSFGLFFAITALLALQMRAGADPALGAGEPLAAATPRRAEGGDPPRVIVTRIVEHRRAASRAPLRAGAPHAGRRSGVAAPRPLRRRRSGRVRPGPREPRSGPAHHPFLVTDDTFDCMGTEVRLLVRRSGRVPRVPRALRRDAQPLPPRQRALPPQRGPQPEVPVSPLLRAAIAAGLAAAGHTGGLVDPTLVPELEAAGYDRTRRTPELPLADAIAAAPAAQTGRTRPR